MDRIARLRRAELERKLRDARKVLREIARPERSAGACRLAAWALELIFDEPRPEEIPAELAMAPLAAEDPLENPIGLPIGADDEGSEPMLAETLPFAYRKDRPFRGDRTALTDELLKQLIG